MQQTAPELKLRNVHSNCNTAECLFVYFNVEKMTLQSHFQKSFVSACVPIGRVPELCPSADCLWQEGFYLWNQCLFTSVFQSTGLLCLFYSHGECCTHKPWGRPATNVANLIFLGGVGFVLFYWGFVSLWFGLLVFPVFLLFIIILGLFGLPQGHECTYSWGARACVMGELDLGKVTNTLMFP